MADEFGDYLARCKAREIENETLVQAKTRALVTKATVYWSGHFVRPDGSMYAYNH